MPVAMACLLGLAFLTPATAYTWEETYAVDANGDPVAIETTGDDEYPLFRTLDHFSLLLEDGHFFYAEISEDGDDITSTGVELGTTNNPASFGLSPDHYLSSDGILWKVYLSRLSAEEPGVWQQKGMQGTKILPTTPTNGRPPKLSEYYFGRLRGRTYVAGKHLNIFGLALPIRFQDDPDVVLDPNTSDVSTGNAFTCFHLTPPGELWRALNKSGYTGFGPRVDVGLQERGARNLAPPYGSVFDYYLENSGGKVYWRNDVLTQYIVLDITRCAFFQLYRTAQSQPGALLSLAITKLNAMLVDPMLSGRDRPHIIKGDTGEVVPLDIYAEHPDHLLRDPSEPASLTNPIYRYDSDADGGIDLVNAIYDETVNMDVSNSTPNPNGYIPPQRGLGVGLSGIAAGFTLTPPFSPSLDNGRIAMNKNPGGSAPDTLYADCYSLNPTNQSLWAKHVAVGNANSFYYGGQSCANFVHENAHRLLGLTHAYHLTRVNAGITAESLDWCGYTPMCGNWGSGFNARNLSAAEKVLAEWVDSKVPQIGVNTVFAERNPPRLDNPASLTYSYPDADCTSPANQTILSCANLPCVGTSCANVIVGTNTHLSNPNQVVEPFTDLDGNPIAIPGSGRLTYQVDDEAQEFGSVAFEVVAPPVNRTDKPDVIMVAYNSETQVYDTRDMVLDTTGTRYELDNSQISGIVWLNEHLSVSNDWTAFIILAYSGTTYAWQVPSIRSHGEVLDYDPELGPNVYMIPNKKSEYPIGSNHFLEFYLIENRHRFTDDTDTFASRDYWSASTGPATEDGGLAIWHVDLRRLSELKRGFIPRLNFNYNTNPPSPNYNNSVFQLWSRQRQTQAGPYLPVDAGDTLAIFPSASTDFIDPNPPIHGRVGLRWYDGSNAGFVLNNIQPASPVSNAQQSSVSMTMDYQEQNLIAFDGPDHIKLRKGAATGTTNITLTFRMLSTAPGNVSWTIVPPVPSADRLNTASQPWLTVLNPVLSGNFNAPGQTQTINVQINTTNLLAHTHNIDEIRVSIPGMDSSISCWVEVDTTTKDYYTEVFNREYLAVGTMDPHFVPNFISPPPDYPNYKYSLKNGKVGCVPYNWNDLDHKTLIFAPINTSALPCEPIAPIPVTVSSTGTTGCPPAGGALNVQEYKYTTAEANALPFCETGVGTPLGEVNGAAHCVVYPLVDRCGNARSFPFYDGTTPHTSIKVHRSGYISFDSNTSCNITDPDDDNGNFLSRHFSSSRITFFAAERFCSDSKGTNYYCDQHKTCTVYGQGEADRFIITVKDLWVSVPDYQNASEKGGAANLVFRNVTCQIALFFDTGRIEMTYNGVDGVPAIIGLSRTSDRTGGQDLPLPCIPNNTTTICMDRANGQPDGIPDNFMNSDLSEGNLTAIERATCPAGVSGVVTFDDYNLESAIREAVGPGFLCNGATNAAPLTEMDIGRITSLFAGGTNPATPYDRPTPRHIHSLAGLEATYLDGNGNIVSVFENLQELDLSYNDLEDSDLLALLDLINNNFISLQKLDISGNRFSSMALSDFLSNVRSGVAITHKEFHSADTDEDGVLSLSELLRLDSFFNGSQTGTVRATCKLSLCMANCGACTEDGYHVGVQALPWTARPHDSDYAPANWSISINELLRGIQLYESCGYSTDNTTLDGFAPMLCKKVQGEHHKDGGANTFTLSRVIDGTTYRPRQEFNITLTLAATDEFYEGGLGIVELIPPNWDFMGIVGNGEIVSRFDSGERSLNLTWNGPVPLTDGETTITYRIRPDFNATGPHLITGTVYDEANNGIRSTATSPTCIRREDATGDSCTGIEFQRAFPEGNHYQLASPILIEVELDALEVPDLRALGVSETAPSGWQFRGLADYGDAPDSYPAVGATGTLEFAWVEPPAFPARFRYYLLPPSGVDGAYQLTGEATYRTTGIAMTSNVVSTWLRSPYHSADTNKDDIISLEELQRVFQLHNGIGYHCDDGGEDGYSIGQENGPETCAPHDADYGPTDWQIDSNESSRVVELYNAGGYHLSPNDLNSPDGFSPN